MVPLVHLSLSEARRIALGALGFSKGPLRREVRADDLRRVIHRLGLVQLDYVKVVAPAHYQVFYSRLGPYRRELFDRIVYSPRREFTEQWAHEASVIPVETWPLLRHRMETRPVWWRGFEDFSRQHPGYCDWMLEEIRTRGPLSADEFTVPDGVERRLEGSWHGNIPRATLEKHFARGAVAVVDRRPSLARVFDVPERALGAEIVERRIHAADADRELVRKAARAYGIGTAADLADYWRSRPPAVKPRIAELVENGELIEAQVEGWTSVAYLHRDAVVPKKIEACTLLAPFDPVVWYRKRTERLFGFEYRLEVFIPPAKRQYGAYVLPFLLGDQIVARVDLKAERAEGRLRVSGAFLEPGMDKAVVGEALSAELRRFAGWLGIERLRFTKRGNLAVALS